MRVLIVDDHPGFRRAARQLLVQDGFDVVGEAKDGKEAIEAVEALRPDVVLLDVQLPDIMGFEVAQILGRTASSPRVVLVSNWEESDFGSATTVASVRGFISKPRLNAKRIRALL